MVVDRELRGEVLVDDEVDMVWNGHMRRDRGLHALGDVSELFHLHVGRALLAGCEDADHADHADPWHSYREEYEAAAAA